jgi:hypothetical protein
MFELLCSELPAFSASAVLRSHAFPCPCHIGARRFRVTSLHYAVFRTARFEDLVAGFNSSREKVWPKLYTLTTADGLGYLSLALILFQLRRGQQPTTFRILATPSARPTAYERIVVTQALLFVRVKHSKLTQSEYIRCCHECFNEFFPSSICRFVELYVSLSMSASSTLYDELSTVTSNTQTSAGSGSTSTTSPASSGFNGLSTGQAVGLAIGCLIAGVLIAAIAAWLLARWKRNRTELSARPQRRSSTTENGVDKRFSSTVMHHIGKSSLNPNFDALLARPLPEDELLALYARLRGLISEHANGYISEQNRSFVRRPDPSFIQRLEVLVGPQSVVPALRLATMLLDRRTQASALRFLFAWTILENVRSSGAPETTLLPPEISECMSSMAGLSNDNKGS